MEGFALKFTKMSGFDEGEIFYSDVFGVDDQQDGNQLTRTAAQKQFKKFIREFHEGTFVYPYRYVLIHFVVRYIWLFFYQRLIFWY